MRTLRIALAVLFVAGSGLAASYDKTNLDTSVAACTDFNQYANGGWKKKNPIPPAYSNWGVATSSTSAIAKRCARSSSAREEQRRRRIGRSEDRRLLRELHGRGARSRSRGSSRCSRSSTASRRSRTPPTSRPDRTPPQRRLQSAVRLRLPAGQEEQRGSDRRRRPGRPRTSRPRLLPQGPIRSRRRSASEYVQYVRKMFELLGDTPKRRRPRRRRSSRSRRSSPRRSLTRVSAATRRTYHRDDAQASVAELTPTFAWAAYFKARRRAADRRAQRRPAGFLQGGRQADLDAVADRRLARRICACTLINAAAPSLSTTFVDANFDFYSTTLRGVEGAAAALEALRRRRPTAPRRSARPGVREDAFPPEAKARSCEMVNRPRRRAARPTSTALDWMSDATEEAGAREAQRVHATRSAIPDKWRDYSPLKIDRGAYVGNVAARASRSNCAATSTRSASRSTAREWGMTPPTVNAYYNPSMNEIVLPGRHPAAAVLRSEAGRRAQLRRNRRGDRPRDDARLRRPGPKFDAEGKSANWWTPAGPRGVQEAGGVHSEAVRRLRRRRRAHERQARLRREHRRPRRAEDRVRRVSEITEGQSSRRSSTATRPSSASSSATRIRGPHRDAPRPSACRRRPTRIRSTASAPTARSPTCRSSRPHSDARRTIRWCARRTSAAWSGNQTKRHPERRVEGPGWKGGAPPPARVLDYARMTAYRR